MKEQMCVDVRACGVWVWLCVWKCECRRCVCSEYNLLRRAYVCCLGTHLRMCAVLVHIGVYVLS